MLSWKGQGSWICVQIIDSTHEMSWVRSNASLCQSCYEFYYLIVVQKLDLQKVSIEEDIDCSNVKGQIVISLTGRDRGGCGPNVTDVSLMSRSDMDGCCSQISPEIIPRNNTLPHGLVSIIVNVTGQVRG